MFSTKYTPDSGGSTAVGAGLQVMFIVYFCTVGMLILFNWPEYTNCTNPVQNVTYFNLKNPR